MEKISIVIPTINRKSEIEDLLKSLESSKHLIKEIIVIDQNCSNLIDPIIQESTGSFNSIIHRKVNFKGASKARNEGVKFATAEIICFPDDDAKFKEDTIPKALEEMNNKNVKVLFGKCVDKENNDSILKFDKNESFITFKSYENKFVESTLFIKKELIEKYQFDENLGVGNFFGAEEGLDLVLRLLRNKVLIFYSPRIVFIHPQKISNYTSPAELKRVFYYRAGFSRLCIKHKLILKLLKRLFFVNIYIVLLLFIKPKKARYYLSELLGLLAGVIVK
jgi:GT2 family glycosyltransferase